MKTIGIDLGTTNTVAAINGQVFALDMQEAILPSVVAFPPSGATLVGAKARRRRAIDPKNTIFSAKRLMGRKWLSPDATEFCNRYPQDVIENQEGKLGFKTRAGTLTPPQISSTVLSAISKESGLDFGQLCGVITVPSMFKDEHRQATLEAAQLAGLSNVELIDEPTAVARAYLNQQQEGVKYAVVYDFGGGTFDLAVLDCTKKSLHVLAHAGDLYLGGDDIDYQLAKWTVDEVLKNERWDLRSDQAVFSRLVVECERAKIRLCGEKQTTIDLTQVDPAAPSNCRAVSVTQDILAKFAESLFRRTFVLCDEVLSKAGVKARDVDAVFPAGGTTLLPMVRHGVETYFGTPLRRDFDPMQVVAIGASIALEHT